ncbi:MAG TPA: DUF6448 family protein [Candidatus Binatia bacterium]|nr:DUF6448 family protein [Candidatus Binatia bacterium]
MMRNLCRAAVHSAILAALVFLGAHQAFAHCDGLDGPVVKAAQKALETGNVNLVLIWVRKNDEGEVKNAFQKTLAVRKLSPQAKELSDMYFFETLVRVHRAAEGEPYTGLKPAGRDLGPAIPTADKALESGKVEPLLKLLTESMQTEIREKFKQVVAKKKYRPDDVEAGRAYVEAYVPLVHYVEQIYEAVKSPSGGHLHHVERESAHR